MTSKPSCAQCGSSSDTLKNCSRCKSVVYCSSACQLRHWVGGHKALCLVIKNGSSEEVAGRGAAIHPSHKPPTLMTVKCSFSLDKKENNITSNEEECANCAAVGNRDGIVLSKCSKRSMVAYCSRACQVQHWKDGEHKRFCVSLVERLPRATTFKTEVIVGPASHAPLDDRGDNCVICGDSMNFSSACMLPCSHQFHKLCIMNIRQFGVSQACPLCRAALPAKHEYAAAVVVPEVSTHRKT